MGWFTVDKSQPSTLAIPQDNNNKEDSTEETETRKFVEGKDGLIVWEPETNQEVTDAVQRIRSRFLEEFELNPDLYIKTDVDMIQEHDYFIRRFLYPHDLNPEPAYEQFRVWMEWRKEVGFENASPTRFPMEFYQIGALFPYGTDKDGTLLLYMRFKVYKRLDILDKAIKQFVVFNMNQLDYEAKRERGWAVVFDTQGAGLAQVDFDMLIFLFKTVKQYYPWGMKYVCIYELPWILHGGWKITQKLLPQDATRLFKFFNRNNITELIDPENLPDFMGGSCEQDYCQVPEGCRPAEEVGEEEMGLTIDQVASVKKHFEKHFAEARKRKKGVVEETSSNNNQDEN
jgi:hypothetical protein